ncbi:MAG: hypothetical protein KKG47_09550 [Proteobacteria bacterium]|nr:hypothetical protein [Pseudomonadota bacterium]MBU1736862.1 hypothetical protein [Pseudomonadota bacterium]
MLKKSLGLIQITASLLLVSILSSGCAGMNKSLLSSDPVISESTRIHKTISELHLEFNDLVEGFVLANDVVCLKKIPHVISEAKLYVERARKLHELQRYYPEGISYHRWKHTGDNVEMGNRRLFEMMMQYADVQMTYSDKTDALLTYREIISTFGDKKYDRYQILAQLRLDEIENRSQAIRAASLHQPEAVLRP